MAYDNESKQPPIARLNLRSNITDNESAPKFLGQLLFFEGAWFDVALFRPRSGESKLAYQGTAKKAGAERDDEPEFLIHLLKPQEPKSYKLYGWVRMYNPETEEFDISNRVYLYTDKVRVLSPAGKWVVAESANVSGIVFPPEEEDAEPPRRGAKLGKKDPVPAEEPPKSKGKAKFRTSANTPKPESVEDDDIPF